MIVICLLEKVQKCNAQILQTLDWEKKFLAFACVDKRQKWFLDSNEFINTSEFKIQKVQNIFWQLWFENLKKKSKDAKMKSLFWNAWIF